MQIRGMTDKNTDERDASCGSGRVSLPFLDLETGPVPQTFALVMIYINDYDIQY